MKIPEKIPGLKWLTLIVIVYAVVWISLEGVLGQVLVLAGGLILVGAAYLVQRLLRGRRVQPASWLFFCALAGLMLGAFSVLLVLLLMSIKTGLHGHGPEFAPSEVTWVIDQWLLWAAAGMIAGLGLGVLTMAIQRR